MSTTILHTSNDVLHERTKQKTVTAHTTLTAADAIYEYNIATDAKVFTLPLITEATLGMQFVIRNIGADGNNSVTISPNAADSINGTIPQTYFDTEVFDGVASGVKNKDFVNLKDYALKGDYVILTAVALTEWYISGGAGVWESEA